jgi:polyisoprenyl-phosphate glycosyltransferase
MVYLSVVIPIYKCNTVLPELVNRLKTSLESISSDFEVILVNDGSPENDWQLIELECKKDARIKGISFSRNFGQHNAISAGLDWAKGEWTIVMDGDLQDSPEDIPKLYYCARENGYDVVFAKRTFRQDSFFKKISSKIFHYCFNFFSGIKSDSAVANFSIINNKVVQAFRKLSENNRDYTFFVNWLGFSKGTIDVIHTARLSGKSSYDIKKLLRLGFDNIVANSNKPLFLSIKFGFFISFVSFLCGIFLITAKIFNFFTIEGWTSIVVSIWFVCGLLMADLGIVGIYLGKVFDETKSRPNYIIAEKLNFIDEG